MRRYSDSVLNEGREFCVFNIFNFILLVLIHWHEQHHTHTHTIYSYPLRNKTISLMEKEWEVKVHRKWRSYFTVTDVLKIDVSAFVNVHIIKYFHNITASRLFSLWDKSKLRLVWAAMQPIHTNKGTKECVTFSQSNSAQKSGLRKYDTRKRIDSFITPWVMLENLIVCEPSHSNELT